MMMMMTHVTRRMRVAVACSVASVLASRVIGERSRDRETWVKTRAVVVTRDARAVRAR